MGQALAGPAGRSGAVAAEFSLATEDAGYALLLARCIVLARLLSVRARIIRILVHVRTLLRQVVEEGLVRRFRLCCWHRRRFDSTCGGLSCLRIPMVCVSFGGRR